MASPTANQGKGWLPIGIWPNTFVGSFDGQEYQIEDLFINRPTEEVVGLFAFVDEGGVIENIGMVNVDVIGYVWVGGLVGENSGTVTSSYSTGRVVGNFPVGGLVGWNTGTISDSFWDIETSGQSTSDFGTGKTTAEMQDIDTFSGATWNIVAVANPSTRNLAYIWNIVDDVTYPFLSWESVS